MRDTQAYDALGILSSLTLPLLATFFPAARIVGERRPEVKSR